MSKVRLSYGAAEILTYLLELAAGQAGFEVRGVRGWASAPVLVERTGIWGAAWLLKTHLRNGRVLQEDVRVPADSRATHVYRITQCGIDTLAAVAGTWPAGIRAPKPCSEPGVLLRDGARAALDALRAAVDAQRRQRPGQGENVWSSSRELGRLLEREDEAAYRPPRWFMSEDLRWLAQHGCVEEQLVGRYYRYRITPAGAGLRALDWREPR